MRWFAWGKQSSIYGVPLGVALLMIGFLMLFNVAEVWGLVVYARNDIDWFGACHVKIGPFTWGSLRWFWLLKILSQVLWALTIAASVAVWRQSETLRKVMLFWPLLYFAEITGALMYTAYAFYTPSERLLYEQDAWFLKRHNLSAGALPWPRRFLVIFPIVCIGYFFFFTLIWDCHFSYHRVVQVGGSGFEGKAFYQIHLQSSDTVESLSDWWSQRLGIDKKKRKGEYDDDDDEEQQNGGGGGGSSSSSSNERAPIFAAA